MKDSFVRLVDIVPIVPSLCKKIEQFEDTKGVTRNRKSKKDGHYNYRKKDTPPKKNKKINKIKTNNVTKDYTEY